MKDRKKFARQLLELEPVTLELECRYRKELEAMLERDLKPVERIAYCIASAMGLVFIALFCTVAWRTWGSVPVLASAGLLSGAVFGFASALFAIRVLRKGRLNLRKDVGFFTGLAWVFMVLLMTLFLALGQQMENVDKGTQMILIGLVFFVMFGVVGMLQYNIQQAELRTREAVLRLEQHVAMLAERLASRD